MHGLNTRLVLAFLRHGRNGSFSILKFERGWRSLSPSENKMGHVQAMNGRWERVEIFCVAMVLKWEEVCVMLQYSLNDPVTCMVSSA